jgi:hypothetical protein
MLEKVLGDVASWCCLYLAAKPSHVGVDMDGLSCLLHHPMTRSHQTRGQGLLLGTAVVGGGAIPGHAKALGLDIHWRVDCLGTYVTEFYMEYIVFTKTCLPYVRVIMAFMRVSLIELPFQTMMG